jgi:hypothetical protein
MNTKNMFDIWHKFDPERFDFDRDRWHPAYWIMFG